MKFLYVKDKKAREENIAAYFNEKYNLPKNGDDVSQIDPAPQEMRDHDTVALAMIRQALRTGPK